MKYREMQERLRAVGIVVSKRGGLIRVNYFGGLEKTALYAKDLEEALDAGLEMAGSEDLPSGWLEGAPKFQDKSSPK